MTDKQDKAIFSMVDFPGVYRATIEVCGRIMVEIKAESQADADRQAREIVEKIEADDEAELDVVDGARVVWTGQKPPLYRVMRRGLKMRVSHVMDGDEPREPDERGF